MTEFMGGAITMAYVIAGMFFLKFWRQSGDRFHAMFAGAFWILGVNRVAQISVPFPDESLPVYYIVRLLAYLLILTAILDKNVRR